jgi:hypothetical protein
MPGLRLSFNEYRCAAGANGACAGVALRQQSLGKAEQLQFLPFWVQIAVGQLLTA